MGRVRVGAVLTALAIAGCGGGGGLALRAGSVSDARHRIPTISTSTPTLLPVSAHSTSLNCPFHDGQGGQGGGAGGQSFELR
jgi:hypothetical protein